MNRSERLTGAITSAMYVVGVVLLLCAAWRGSARAGDSAREEARAALAAEVGQAGGLMVVFRPEDCEENARFIRSWQSFATSDTVFVLGVPLTAARRDAWVARAVADLAGAYPLREDLEPHVRVLVRGWPRFQTPAAILLDGSGRVRVVVPATADPDRIRRAHRLISDYISFSS